MTAVGQAGVAAVSVADVIVVAVAVAAVAVAPVHVAAVPVAAGGLCQMPKVQVHLLAFLVAPAFPADTSSTSLQDPRKQSCDMAGQQVL